jgi:hypothetical protein
MHEEEFFGKLDFDLIKDEKTFRPEVIDWIVINPDQSTNRVRRIEDGDFLQVFDPNGRILLNKKITRDYKALFNVRYGKQMYNGMCFKWLPYGIDVNYWYSMFINNHRARIVKYSEETAEN